MIDPHTHEYMARLRDEPVFLALGTKVLEYLQRWAAWGWEKHWQGVRREDKGHARERSPGLRDDGCITGQRALSDL